MIRWNEKERAFKIDTERSTYLIHICGNAGYAGHTYYGPKIPDDNLSFLLRIGKDLELPETDKRDMVHFGYRFPAEYPGHGNGDDRFSCLIPELSDGTVRFEPVFSSYRIYRGKPKLEALPACFGTEEDTETLELVLEDPDAKIRAVLLYSVFSGIDAVVRSARIENCGTQDITLRQALSACLELDEPDLDVITLHGDWAGERMIQRRPLGPGKTSVSSHRGISSHEEHPFMAFPAHTATQEEGEVYGMTLLYSGNFLALAEKNPYERTRAVIGILPEDFSWKLAPGESFQTPEAVFVFSDGGIGQMSRTFHDLFRQHLIRGEYKTRPRPVLINNWEATYFDFNTDKLLEIGRTAAKAGIELFVLDDGWFGKRDDDTSSLGDWKVNGQKLPGGLKYLAGELNRMGMKFGIWMEPEMVSPDSDFYRAHPDYALSIPGRHLTLQRSQLVLDMTRKEVRDAVYQQISGVLHSANIEYVKWDMNRPLCDLYSTGLPAERMGELYHRYVLGVYELQERLITEFPHLLLENCASGGGRFDAGMLYYSPQIWTSDNTDALCRLMIQEGTAILYPYSSMGAHVAACPSHSTGRTVPFETRGRVSLPGCFGYELDLTRLDPETELATIPQQIEEYRQYRDVFHHGDYYRLASYASNGKYDILMAVSKDRETAVICYVQVLSSRIGRTARQKLYGLDPDAYYRRKGTDEIRSGAGWMHGGILLERINGDMQSRLIVLDKVESPNL